MIGRNGALFGSRRTTTTSAGTGIWTPNEQVELRRANLWPLSIPPDPNYSNVRFLCSFDGSENQTTATDSSPSPKSITFSGNAKLSAASARFGTAGLSVDGTDDFVTVASDASMALGTSNFTIELWARIKQGDRNGGLLTFGGSSSGTYIATNGGNWSIGFFGGNGNGMGTTSADINVWRHLALVRSSGVVRFYIDGTQKGSDLSDPGNLADNTLKIGYYYSSQYGIPADIDEVRLTVGTARYTSAFTPPTAAFPTN